ncbi:MAG: hypothetical protein ABW219_13250 [Ilumatobacteraceae bacterium]
MGRADIVTSGADALVHLAWRFHPPGTNARRGTTTWPTPRLAGDAGGALRVHEIASGLGARE